MWCVVQLFVYARSEVRAALGDMHAHKLKQVSKPGRVSCYARMHKCAIMLCVTRPFMFASSEVRAALCDMHAHNVQ